MHCVGISHCLENAQRMIIGLKPGLHIVVTIAEYASDVAPEWIRFLGNRECLNFKSLFCLQIVAEKLSQRGFEIKLIFL